MSPHQNLDIINLIKSLKIIIMYQFQAVKK
jgi:hypothetical protein